MASQIPGVLLDKVRIRWENARKTFKDIFSQTLRKLMPNLKNAEVNKALKENEGKMTLRFNTCLILIKNIESIVKSSTTTWKNIYQLNEPSVETIIIKDIEDDSDEGEDDEAVTETV